MNSLDDEFRFVELNMMATVGGDDLSAVLRKSNHGRLILLVVFLKGLRVRTGFFGYSAGHDNERHVSKWLFPFFTRHQLNQFV